MFSGAGTSKRGGCECRMDGTGHCLGLWLERQRSVVSPGESYERMEFQVRRKRRLILEFLSLLSQGSFSRVYYITGQHPECSEYFLYVFFFLQFFLFYKKFEELLISPDYMQGHT